MTRGIEITIGFVGVLCLLSASAVRSSDDPDAGSSSSLPESAGLERWSIHAQFTGVVQYHPPFHAAFRGPNSFDTGNRAEETIDSTLFAGVRLWPGAAAYVDPEVDQGFGLSDTLGVAGFTSGEAYKVGATGPYVRVPRAFVRQVIGIGDGGETTEKPGPNQLGGSEPSDNVTLTVGKFGTVDIFDANDYAHDPRKDFLNWSIIECGAFDYAADAWGYTYGAAAEWTESWWTIRWGAFDMSRIPNSKYLDHHFGQFALIGEAEERHTLLDHPGKVSFLGFVNRARMADYEDAVRLARTTGEIPDVSLVRHYASRPGIGLNLQQEIVSGVGVFARASLNDGRKEAYEFTEINRSVSFGASFNGDRWARPNDTFGIAGAVNGISGEARDYFAAGGLGILIGDGALRRYGLEKVLETYYSLQPIEHLAISLDYQFIVDPAYNRDRGPVSVLGLRVHVEA